MNHRATVPTHVSDQHQPRRNRIRRDPHEIPLNEWQAQLLQNIADGYTVKQMAEKYYLTNSGIRNSLAIAKKKLQARTYTEAACHALRQNIIS